jgi:hypothetical protein
MKICFVVFSSLVTLGIAFQGHAAESDRANSVEKHGPMPAYIVGERGSNIREWLKLATSTNESGAIVTTTNRAYVEIGTGLHYQGKKGEWLESQEIIEPLPGGGAAATKGQHQAYFPSDIYAGALELVTPDGRHLRSRPLGISYFDGTNSVLIAELTNSMGELLPSGNQVIYPNAFNGVSADIVYTYRKSGFESDVVFRGRIPSPEEWGMSSSQTRLQLLTEWFDAPEPEKETRSARRKGDLSDTTLKFGATRFIPGKAFLTDMMSGEAGPQDSRSAKAALQREMGIPVSKSWEHLSDTQNRGVSRTFLIEELWYPQIAPQFEQLQASVNRGVRVAVAGAGLRKVSATRLLPAMRALPTHKLAATKMQMAKASVNSGRGVVLDWIAINPSQSDFTFKADQTYLVSGPADFSGTTTFEGGTVIKSDPQVDYGSVNVWGPAVYNTESYRPAVFTSRSDNSIGENVSISGAPTNYHGGLYVDSDTTLLKHLRFCYADGYGFHGHNFAMTDVQFVNCPSGLLIEWWGNGGFSCNLTNVLMYNVQVPFCGMGFSVTGCNLTIGGCDTLTADWLFSAPDTVMLVNSLLVDVPDDGPAAIITDHTARAFTTNGPVFQVAGAGYCYLTNGSPYRNAGTTNVDPGLLALLAKRTTYPPLIYSNITVSTNVVLSPQAQRDTDIPDLGYHYDPLDYIASRFTVTNAAVTVTAGTAIACYNDLGIVPEDGSTFVSIGTPLAPNWFTHYQAVQEQPISIVYTPNSGYAVVAYHYGDTGPAGTFRFSKFSCMAGGVYNLYDYSSWSFSNLSVQDSESWGGLNNLGGAANTVVTLRNSLFFRGTINTLISSTNETLSLSNNLAWNVSLTVRPGGSTNTFSFFNNSFDTCTFSTAQGPSVNDYNAYINCNKQLTPTNAHNVVLTNFTYAVGPLGNFYQYSTNLIDRGSMTADLTGLYHYTVLTNLVGGLEIKETNSVVDIGYHYVAVDNNGIPIDTDGDGLADYFEDVNGNGTYEADIDLCNWLAADTDLDGIADGIEIGRGTNPRDPASGALAWFSDVSQGSDSYNGRAAVWNGTDGPFATINKSLDSAIDGDTVTVEGGIYHESIDLSGKNINFLIDGTMELQ